jgi:hypothetical protein
MSEFDTETDPYFQAISERIQSSDPRLAGRVFDTALQRNGKPRTGTYVVLFLGNPTALEAGRLTLAQSPTSDAIHDFTARSVAEGPDGARAIARSLFNALVGFKPVVDGRDCSKIKSRGSDPVQWDTDAPAPIFFSDDDYRFRSYAA